MTCHLKVDKPSIFSSSTSTLWSSFYPKSRGVRLGTLQVHRFPFSPPRKLHRETLGESIDRCTC